MKESHSVDLGNSGTTGINKGFGVSVSKMKGVPLDSGLATPGGEIADPFEEFNSVTLHHDGDDNMHGETSANGYSRAGESGSVNGSTTGSQR